MRRARQTSLDSSACTRGAVAAAKGATSRVQLPRRSEEQHALKRGAIDASSPSPSLPPLSSSLSSLTLGPRIKRLFVYHGAAWQCAPPVPLGNHALHWITKCCDVRVLPPVRNLVQAELNVARDDARLVEVTPDNGLLLARHKVIVTVLEVVAVDERNAVHPRAALLEVPRATLHRAHVKRALQARLPKGVAVVQ